MVLAMLFSLLPGFSFAEEAISDDFIDEEEANLLTEGNEQEPCEHEWVAVDYADATCTADGFISYSCSICEAAYTETLGALGHNYGDGVITEEPSCSDRGVMVFSCSRCEDSYTEVVPALGHSWDEGTVFAPTCTEGGYTLYTCTRDNCGAETEENFTEALGHDWQEVEEVVATEDDPGHPAGKVCSRCGEFIPNQETVVLSINPEEIEEIIEEIPATTTPEITILEQPVDAEIENGIAAFSVTAAVQPEGTELHWQWQRLNNCLEYETSEAREESWEMLSGENDSTLCLMGLDNPAALLEASGYLYRCRITAGDVSLLTGEVRLLADVREFDRDVITGFTDRQLDTIVLDDKPVLMVLEGYFPEEISVLLGGTATYTTDEAGNAVLQSVVDAEQMTVPVAWQCEQNYDEDREEFTFVPVLDNSETDGSLSDSSIFGDSELAPGLELPKLAVQVGDIAIGPVSGYIPTGLSVPWVGGGMKKGAYEEKYVPITYNDQGVITSSRLPALRDQSMEGTCWAHAAIGSIEADLIHDGRADNTIDLSELYLAYNASHYVANQPNYPSLRYTTGDSITSGSAYLKNGGNALLSLRTMANGAGPVLESAAPYYDRASYVPAGDEQPVYQLTRAYLINPADIEAIKAAILTHYGVDAGMYVPSGSGGAWFSSTHNSFYYPGSGSPNHAIMLVGWDDSFSRENFVGIPEGDGAWLVRNSWADGSYINTIGFGSYFWISYYDAGLLSDVVAAYDVESGVYDYCYAYDAVPLPAGYYSLNANTPLVQTYTIKENEVIKAVGFETGSANLEAKIKVQVGNAEPVETYAWTTCAGFYLISLSSPVSAAADSTVTVSLQFTAAANVVMERSNSSLLNGSITYSAACDSGGCKVGTQTLPYDAHLKLYTVRDYSVDNLKEVTSLSLPAALTLAVRESEQLTPEISPTNASNKDLSWSSSNPSAARVDNGLVIGVSSGTSRITVTSRNGKSASCDVTVVDVRVTGVHLSDTLDRDPNDSNQKYTLFNDDQFYPLEESGYDIDLSTFSISYSYTVVPSNASNKKVTWTSSDPSVISVNASSGDCRIVGNGESILTVTTRESNYSDSVKIKVDLSTYTVSYNANGGANAPAAQTKYKHLPLTLSSAAPTRPGYSFQGWAASAGGPVVYAPGGRYAENASVTLYAVWKAVEYTVSYDANGGSGAPGNQIKYQDTPLALSTVQPSRAGYSFLGWSESASAASAQYQPGGIYQNNTSITLYAVWQANDPVEEFVRRCYRLILGREGEAAGVENWANALKAGTRTGAEIVSGFINSQEFANRRQSNEEVVTILYRAMMGREPDSGGKATWLSVLDSGCSYDYIVDGFSGSQEFGNICASYGIRPGRVNLTQPRDRNRQVTAFVNRNYIYALNRQGESGGLNQWCDMLLRKAQTPQQVAHNFVFSQECVNRNLNNRDFVVMLYHLYMGREPDETGLNNWKSALDRGVSREKVVQDFSQSQEFRNIVASYGL